MGYQIIIEEHYLAGTIRNRAAVSFLRNEKNEIEEFETYEKAEKWIKKETGGIYLLSHGEYSSPDYKICEDYDIYEALNIGSDFLSITESDLPADAEIIKYEDMPIEAARELESTGGVDYNSEEGGIEFWNQETSVFYEDENEEIGWRYGEAYLIRSICVEKGFSAYGSLDYLDWDGNGVYYKVPA